jgi:cytochrome P450
MSSQTNLPPKVGTLQEYSEAPFETRTEWAKVNDIVRIAGEDVDHHMLAHPDLIEQVLFSDSESYIKIDSYDSVFGDGMVTAYGEQWRAQRRAIQPEFQPAKIQSYAEKIERIAQDAVDGIEDGETIDARDLFTDLTMEVMLESLFGGSEGKKDTIGRAASRITEWFIEDASAGAVPPEVQSDFDRGLDNIISLIDEMIEDRERGERSGDMLSMLVELGPESDANYTDERIRDEMITMLFGAHETTALTLTYTLYLLADAPEVEAKLLDELDTVLDGDAPGGEHLADLTYTEQVINEGLRMYCPAHTLFRETIEDVRLDGYTVPEGDMLYLPQWVIHRDERWWDEPLEFRPERFAGESDRHSFAFFPFGVGARRCIGEPFARAEAKIVLAALVDQFSLERETEEFGLHASITAVPDRPIELTAHTRE